MPILAGHPCKSCMYDPIHCKYYWPRMASTFHPTVRDFWKSSQNKLSEKWWRPVQLFSAIGRLEFVVMNILEPLLETLSGNQLVLVMRNCFKKLTRAVPTSKTTVRVSRQYYWTTGYSRMESLNNFWRTTEPISPEHFSSCYAPFWY